VRTLHAIPFSPWSEKARWALDHHGIDYREVVFTPPFDEPLLRLRTGNWRGNISAPLFFDGGRPYTDSWDIARYADERGGKQTLFPPEHMQGIVRMNELSQEALEAGRAIILARLVESDDALRDMAPRPVAKLLGPLTPVVTRRVIERTRRKWGADRRSEAEALVVCERALVTLREALGAKPYLFGAFSYADITASQILGMVKPVVHPRFKMKSRARERFTIESLASRFGDLIVWRDGLYARHRMPS
jgi:glutathione S-transferase